MGAVKIKANQNGLQLTFSPENWEEQCQQVRQKLRLLKTKEGHPVEVFFESNQVKSDQIIELLSLLQECGCVCERMEPCINANVLPAFHVVSQTLHSDQPHHFQGNTLLLEDVRRGVQIEVEDGSLYVMGKVSGRISLTDKLQRVIAMSYDKAQVKISDSIWQNVTNCAKVCVYYENQKCIVVCLKEEEVWQG